MEDQSVSPRQRRRFLTVLLGGVGAVLAVMGGWPVLRFLSPLSTSGAGGQVKIAKDQVPLGGAHFFDYQGHPAVLLQYKPGEYRALTAVCTHLGCIVKWVAAKDEFLCPCHGGRYAADGAVLAGPPPAPLKTYPVSVSGDQIVVG